MRRSINLLVTAVTGLVVVAFVVPLALLVRQQADQRGRIEAERTAQTLAAVVVRSLAAADSVLSADRLADSIGPLPGGSAVLLPDGTVIGDTTPFADLVDDVVASSSTRSAYLPDGYGLAIPVLTRSGAVVVYASVPATALSEGVVGAWILLGLLAFFLVAAAVVVADRLGRSVVGPSRRLGEAAERLGQGDLTTRVMEEGPPELQSMGAAFNLLATRVTDLLDAEREQIADLSHRLRTPLTALRLQAEQIEDSAERVSVLDKVDRLRGAVDQIIRDARHRPQQAASCDIVAVVETRTTFWAVLAEEEARTVSVDLVDGPVPIPMPAEDLAATLDALIGNVFSHTEPGVGFSVAVGTDATSAILTVGDDGSGFPDDMDPSGRGVSGSGSSGLGLDIARRLAETHEGSMVLGRSPSGGATITLTLPRQTV